MLSKDPVTDNSHLRYFCKVVYKDAAVCNIDDSEPRCRAHLILAFKLTYVRCHHYTAATRSSTLAVSFLPLLKQLVCRPCALRSACWSPHPISECTKPTSDGICEARSCTSCWMKLLQPSSYGICEWISWTMTMHLTCYYLGLC
ncbi:hypothetical protein GQ55_1G419900 [Panicum hallii var. hallii]|uniref:Uncharacterized protein n=1 Tax=Panicum hallii var. hallii TaxID=1504633 RepID=A0A2T7FD76_9POAL|nr:hypothetical protein GQ55_1G419900 [Panicum hallii var. hallii]